jgi:TATA-box binding protein (TBP) (component of TFIID and TFIIIB)
VLGLKKVLIQASTCVSFVMHDAYSVGNIVCSFDINVKLKLARLLNMVSFYDKLY